MAHHNQRTKWFMFMHPFFLQLSIKIYIPIPPKQQQQPDNNQTSPLRPLRWRCLAIKYHDDLLSRNISQGEFSIPLTANGENNPTK